MRWLFALLVAVSSWAGSVSGSMLSHTNSSSSGVALSTLSTAYPDAPLICVTPSAVGHLSSTLSLQNSLIYPQLRLVGILLILVGVLIAKGAMSFPVTLVVLTTAASLGCWVSYIQGRWLGNTKVVQGWLSHLPAHYHQRAHNLFHRHGLSALLVGRFLAFVRTLLPTIAGLSGLSNARFQFFNWMSGLLWVLILTTMGFAFGKTPVFLRYEDEVMFVLMLLPLALLVIGLFGSLYVLWRKKNAAASPTSTDDGNDKGKPE